jgi:hypothetical protein
MDAEKISIVQREKDGFTQIGADVERRYSQIKTQRGVEKKICVNQREINQRKSAREEKDGFTQMFAD